jgi:TPR repeat protein
MELFRKAAQQGNARARLFFGLAYDKDSSVAEDATVAIEWFRQVAFPVLYQREVLNKRFPRSVPVTPAAATVECYRLAIELGCPISQYHVGLACCNSQYHELGEAGIEWFRKAAIQGYPPAQCAVGRQNEKEGEYVAAVLWYEKAAEQGHAGADDALRRMPANETLEEREENKRKLWRMKKLKFKELRSAGKPAEEAMKEMEEVKLMILNVAGREVEWEDPRDRFQTL